MQRIVMRTTAIKGSVLIGILILNVGLLTIFLQTAHIWAAPVVPADGEPAITAIIVTGTLPVYTGDTGTNNRMVYFDNAQSGILNTTFTLAGTPPLTFTAMAAFGQPTGVFTFTSTPTQMPVSYRVSVAQTSQPDIIYTVVNTAGITATAVISYLRDITPPVATLDSLPFGGFVVTTTNPTLILTGTVSDDESGVQHVWLDPGDGGFVPAALADTGSWVPQTTWSYTWHVPLVDSGVYTLHYYAEDNIGKLQTSQAYSITVDNDPVANDDNNYQTSKNESLTVAAPGVLENDDDPRGRGLTAVLVTPAVNGTLTFNLDGSFVYTPNTSFVGNDTFTYKANNGFNNSNTATVVIAVIDDPDAVDDEYSTNRNSSLAIPAPGVLENDVDPLNRVLNAMLVTPPAHGELTLEPNGAFIYTPTLNFAEDDQFTYKATYENQESDVAVVTIHVAATDVYIYLPMITKPPFEAWGTLGFVETGHRFAGITTFVPEIPLTFEDIHFTYLPNEMKIWVGDTEPVNWIPYAATHMFTLTAPIIGGQEVHVRFRYGGQESDPISDVFFYIPNGDFQDVSDTGWSLAGAGLGLPSIANGQLRLGSDTYGCSNVPFPAAATAAITLTVPTIGSFILHVDASVYTYDKLPDPNQGVYDAFEIHVGDQIIERHGYNGAALLNCNTQRTVNVGSSLALSSGSQTISLQNWSRFDGYYNTYTDVGQIWVDK